jgi:hypothetical protein
MDRLRREERGVLPLARNTVATTVARELPVRLFGEPFGTVINLPIEEHMTIQFSAAAEALIHQKMEQHQTPSIESLIVMALSLLTRDSQTELDDETLADIEAAKLTPSIPWAQAKAEILTQVEKNRIELANSGSIQVLAK